MYLSQNEIKGNSAEEIRTQEKCRPKGGIFLEDYLDFFSHCWLAIPQLVLQADWQEVWHSPQPPFFALSQRFLVSRVLICFIFMSSKRVVRFIITHNPPKVNYPRQFFCYLFYVSRTVRFPSFCEARATRRPHRICAPRFR